MGGVFVLGLFGVSPLQLACRIHMCIQIADVCRNNRGVYPYWRRKHAIARNCVFAFK